MNPLFQICQWLNDTQVATALRESEFVYPLIETIHVLAIILLFGTVAVVDLRLLGVLFPRERVSRIAGQILPLTRSGFVVMLLSGAALFLAQATKSYSNPAFRWKLALLFLASLNPMIFHSTIYREVASWDLARVAPWRGRLTAVFSLFLWIGVIVAGRSMAYFK